MEPVRRGRDDLALTAGDAHAAQPQWSPSGEDGTTKAAILDAIRARRCYATSGVPILLDVRLNGVLMGGTATVEPGSPIVMEVRVVGTAPIRAVYVVKDGDDVYRVEGGGATNVGFEYEEKAFDGVSPRDSFYYVRVVQQDGEAAWSSPIWVQPLDAGHGV